MAAAPTWQDYYDLGKSVALDKRPELDILDGDVSDMIIAGVAAGADRLTGYAADRFRATYLDGASGDDLTTLCDDHWNIQRIVAVASTGTVSFSRVDTTLSVSILAGTVVSTTKDANGNEQRFTTDTDVIFNSGDAGPNDVTITNEVGGLDGNVAAGTVINILSDMGGNSFTVTNAAACIGGSDEETDVQLRERVRNFPATIRRGTLGALEYGAQQVTSVKLASAVEETDANNITTGLTFVYVSDIDGNSNDSMVTAVQNELDSNWRAAGAYVLVLGGSIYTQNVTLRITARVGVDTNTLANNVVAAITARINKLKIGEVLYISVIKQTVLNVDPVAILEVHVDTPATDVAPPADQIIRAGTITVS